MDIKEEIEELKNKIRELEAKIEKETKNTANDGWKPEYGETYWFVDLDMMDINKSRWFIGGTDKVRLKHKVIFETEEEAEEYLEYLKEKEKHMNTFTDEEWGDSITLKYYYKYDREEECMYVRNVIIEKQNIPYFRTIKETESFFVKYAWQIKHELGVD